MLRVVGIVYLAALVLGLGTLLLQTLLSHGGGEVGHADDLGAEVEHGEMEHGAEGEGGHGTEAHAAGLAGAAALLLSTRFWTFALAAFGMAGAALHYLHLAGVVLTLVLASGSGLGSGLVAALVFRAVKQGVSSSSTPDDAVGKVGRVLVPVRKGQTGKVRIEVKGKTLDVLATTDGAEVAEGDSVLVVEMRGSSACVEPMPGKQE
jgi:membrane protein implicated in regulation of membrane protease activity